MPIARKPNYLPYPYNSDESEEGTQNIKTFESEIGNCSSDISSKTPKSKDLVVKIGNVSSEINVEVEKTKSLNEKRNMFVKIEQSQLDEYGLDFLKQDEKLIRNTVSTMCHSLRFWLCVKYFDLIGPTTAGKKEKSVMTKAKISSIFGIGRAALFKFCSKNKDKKTFLDFDGYSPLEYANLITCSHSRVFEDLALNFDSPLVQGIIRSKK